jgi:peptidoglycan biosynthesis protein MviN/MurJ (putative lipid II flippase)
MLVARGFYAQGNTWTPTIVGSVIMLAIFPLYGWLAEEGGGYGLAMASSTAIVCYVTVLMVLLRRSLGGADAPPSGLLLLVIRMVIATIAGVLVGWTIGDAISGWPALFRGGIAGLGAIGASAAVALVLRVPEVKELRGHLSRLRERRSNG